MSQEVTDWGVTIAALLHFVQLPSMNAIRRSYAASELSALSPFARAVLLLFSTGIIACVTGLGVILLYNHGLVLCTAVGRSLCAFLGVFWTLRGLAQSLLLSSIWPLHLNWLHRFLSLFYPFLGALYLWLSWVAA